MWLKLEAGTARGLNRRHGTSFVVPDYPNPGRHGPKALIVEAADSVLPEACVEDLPALAAAELEAGLGGPLRERIAVSEPEDPKLALLRDELVARFGGAADGVGALTVTDRVYLGRLVHDLVPPIIAAGCICWYGAWRADRGPSLDMAAAMSRLRQNWCDLPGDRGRIDDELRVIAGGVVGDNPTDLVSAHA